MNLIINIISRSASVSLALSFPRKSAAYLIIILSGTSSSTCLKLISVFSSSLTLFPLFFLPPVKGALSTTNCTNEKSRNPPLYCPFLYLLPHFQCQSLTFNQSLTLPLLFPQCLPFIHLSITPMATIHVIQTTIMSCLEYCNSLLTRCVPNFFMSWHT